MLSGHPGQVDSSGQVTFHFHLPDWQEIRQVPCQLNHQKNKTKLRLTQDKQYLRDTCTCPRGKLRFKLFFSPGMQVNKNDLFMTWLLNSLTIDELGAGAL